jgi:prophage regulatory protein
MTMERITRFLRLPAVIEMVGLQRTAIYGRIKEGTFPVPVQLGPRAVAWDEQDIVEWQSKLTRGVKKALL